MISSHRGLDGQLLKVETAAVEVIHILRPTVAVSRFVTFAALALHQHPQWRERLRTGGEDDLRIFVQEVRRVSPFFPLITGRVDQPFEWRGRQFAKGDWVMLDLFGTNHDPRSWQRPDEFDPERFRDWNGNPFAFIPQGGGDYLQDHRCAGEWITIELMRTAVRLLTREMDYDVPEQNLKVWYPRMPAVPQSGFVICNARLRRRGADAFA